MNQRTPAPTVARYASIDDVLGSRETRFFGDGFRRTQHHLRDTSIFSGEAGATRLTSRAGVTYPENWSRKGQMDQRPHLSTIDVLVIAAQLSELLVAHELRLNRSQRRAAALRTVRIKAGRTPVEEELADFAATARVLRTVDDTGGTARTGTSCTVGNLRAECEILHPAESRSRDEADAFAWGEPDDPQRSLYAGAFRRRRQFLEDIEADFGASRARARLRTVFGEQTEGAPQGLDATLYFAASPVDCFAAALQLGQFLLYQLDGIPRAQSQTLWMRGTTLELDPHRDALPAAASTVTSLEHSQLLKNAQGEVWRTADIVGELHGTRVRCSVAHRIPENLQ